ncbi:MAG: F0F1 ATP synthase subunit B [Anaerolineaceae bacterium]
MEKLGINLGLLIVQILNFAIIFVVLRAWVYKPLMKVMDKRKKTIAQSLEDARIASDARTNAETEAEKIITEAQAKAAEVLREATTRASKVEHDLKARSDDEIKKAREVALAEVEQDRARMLGELRGQVISLAMAASHKLIGESLLHDEKHQRALLAEFFSGVKAGKLTLLDQYDYKGSKAEVTSALPLSDDEQSIVRRDLAKSMSENGIIEFKVNPGILGGLVIRVDDQVVDGSVAGQLEGMRQELI